MVNIDFNITERNLRDAGFSLPEKVYIKIPEAEYCLRQGLKRYACENYKWLPAYREIADWLSDNKGRGLLLIGSCGLGKTTIGYKIIPALINWYYKKVVTPFTLHDINTRLDEVKKKHLVYIDDIGQEGIAVNYGNKRCAFPEIVDEAERRGHLLIVTSNLSISGIEETYGERTISRLHSITKPILLEGEDMRIFLK